MPKYEELQGKVAIVTGAGRGIGKAIAFRLAREGVAVVVTDIDPHSAERTAAEIRQTYGKALGFKVDVTRREEADSMVSRTVSEFGALNILVNNAGVGAVASILDTDEATWDWVMNVNAKGVFLCSQAAARQMIQQGKGGRIITNASGAGKIAPGKTTPLGVYAASKHAVVGLMKQLGLELSSHQILVNSICGGIIDTPMWDLIDREISKLEGTPLGSVKARAVASVPLGRIQKPEDLANVVAFLASDDANYLTADTINAAGGLLPY
jgi:meso-butanediol dehydrogenase / (S,S)-butanediol dehydrogenase / diacetyl reductase